MDFVCKRIVLLEIPWVGGIWRKYLGNTSLYSCLLHFWDGGPGDGRFTRRTTTVVPSFVTYQHLFTY